MSTQKNDGGPAFPLGDFQWTDPVCNNGMSLRDYFAGKALAGIMAQDTERHNARHKVAEKQGVTPTNLIASEAYQIADAMLKAREGKQ